MAVFKAVGCQRRGVAPLDGSAQEAEQRADPGLIQVVDKNKRVYWGTPPLRGGCSAGAPELEGSDPQSISPLSRGLALSPV